MGWHYTFLPRDHGHFRALWHVALCGRVGGNLSALSLVCQRGTDVLCLRMGIDTAGGLLFRHVPGQLEGCATARSHLAFSMAAVSDHVRRGANQAEGRSLLERS